MHILLVVVAHVEGTNVSHGTVLNEGCIRLCIGYGEFFVLLVSTTVMLFMVSPLFGCLLRCELRALVAKDFHCLRITDTEATYGHMY